MTSEQFPRPGEVASSSLVGTLAMQTRPTLASRVGGGQKTHSLLVEGIRFL